MLALAILACVCAAFAYDSTLPTPITAHDLSQHENRHEYRNGYPRRRKLDTLPPEVIHILLILLLVIMKMTFRRLHCILDMALIFLIFTLALRLSGNP